MAELSDAEVFGNAPQPSPAVAAPPAKELSDDEVFGAAPAATPVATAPKEQSDEEVFSTPQAPVAATQESAPTPSIVDYGLEAGKAIGYGLSTNLSSALKGGAGNARGPALPPSAVMSPLEQGLAEEEQKQFATGLVPVKENPLYTAGQAVDVAANKVFPAGPGFENSWTRDIFSGFGSLGGNVALSLLGPGAAALAMVNAGSGEAVDNAIKAGATQEQIQRASELGGAAGATDLVDALLPTLGTPGKVAGFLGKVGAKIVTGALAEGGQEGLQQLIQNAIAKGVYKPDQDIVEGVGYNALIGAIVGGAAKPILDREHHATEAATPEATKAAHDALVSSPIPTGPDPSTLNAIPPAPEQAPQSPPIPTPDTTQASPPGTSPIELILNPPPMSPTAAHVREASPLSPNADSLAAEVAPVFMEPPEAKPLQAERLAPPVMPSASDADEALKSIYEVLGEEAKPKPVEAPKVERAPELIESGIDFAKLTQVGPQLGSNKGGTYVEPQTGQKFYVKEGQSKAHVENEVAASRLYHLAGVNTLDYVPVKGGTHIATMLVPLQADNLAALSPVYREELKRDFAVHAWLGNWDVVGLSGDNVGMVNDEPTILDLGGALDYRAQGAPKGAKFGNIVDEVYTLRDPLTNPSAASLFGDMSDMDVAKSMQKVLAISDDDIRAAAGSKELGDKLVARKKDLAAKYLNMNSTADEWIDALVNSGESQKVPEPPPSKDALDSLLEAPAETPFDYLLKGNNQLVALDEANKFVDQAGAKAAILAHNKKINANFKKQLPSVAMKVKPNAKKWTLYHGSHASKEFEKFKNPDDKPQERGLFFSPSEKFAKNFSGGGIVYKVEITPGKTKVVDLAKAIASPKFIDRVIADKVKSQWKHLAPGIQKNYIDDFRGYLKEIQKARKIKVANNVKAKKDYFLKYGVPKIIDEYKTGYDWGGIHSAIEMAREEGLDTLILRNINEGGGHDQIVVISPNRVFNLNTKKMMFSASMGGMQFNTQKLTPEAAAKRGPLQSDVMGLLRQVALMAKNQRLIKLAVQQVAGQDVANRTITPKNIKLAPGQQIGGWGGPVKDLLGQYDPHAEMDMTIPLIAVAVAGPSERALATAYHESWHAIEGTLTSEEVATLRADTPALRQWISQLYPENANLYAKAEPEEIWAESAAFYSTAKTQNVAKIYNGPGAAVLEKIWQLVQSIKRIAEKYGFVRSADVFERFYAGEMAERRAGLPTDMLERWWAREGGYDQQLSEVQGKLASATERNSVALRQVDKGIQTVPAQLETLVIRDAVGKLFSMTHGAPPPQVQQALAYADVMAKRHKWFWGLDRLVDLNLNFTPLTKYAELIRLMRLDATKIHDKGQQIAKDWRRLGKQSEPLGKLIDYVANMRYRTPKEVQQGVSRHPTVQEFQAAVAQFGVGNDALAVFQKQKRFFEGFLKLTTQNAIETAQRTITNPVALANKIVAIQTKEAQLLSKPYFPFLRFGQHYVAIRNSQGNMIHFETFERKGLRSAEAVQMAAKKFYATKLNPGDVISHGTLPESAAPFIGLPPELLESIQNELTNMPGTGGQTPGLTQDQVDAIEMLRYAASPASSFAHRFQNKDYVPGYSDDFLRSFSRYVFQGGRYYSRTKYAWALKKQIADAIKLGKTANDNKVGSIANYMSDHLYNTTLDATRDSGLLKGAAFLWFLGFSPAAATVNLTQVPFVSYPWFSANFGGFGFGNKRAAQSLIKAMTDVKNLYQSKSQLAGVNAQSPFVLRALDYGIKTGRISESQASELAGLAQGSTLLGLGNDRVRRGIIKFQEMGAWMFETAEQFNRRVTYRAALDLAMKYPNSKAVKNALLKNADEYAQLVQSGYNAVEASAIVTAAYATEQTQFVYAKENRPRFMKGKYVGAVTVFQTYLVNLLQLMGADKKSFLPQYAILALAAYGLMGLPGADDATDIMNFIGKWLFGKDFNVERKLRETLTALAGDKADVLLHGLARRGWGLPALIDMLGEKPGRGLGSGPANNIPVPVLDRSKAGSASRILPFDLGKILDPQDVDKTISQQTQQASGAIFGVGFNLYRALMDQSTSAGDFKRWEKAMPRALASVSSAYRAYSEGRTRGRGGPAGAATVVPYDIRDPEQAAEVIAMALGYSPLRQSAKWDLIMAQQEIQNKLKIEQQLVLQNRFEAQMGGNPEEIERANAAVRKYNDELPDYARGYKISADTLISSMEERARQKTLREAGIPTQRRNKPISDYIQSLFPESVVDVRKLR